MKVRMLSGLLLPISDHLQCVSVEPGKSWGHCQKFCLESEMSGNIWSECLRDRFDFQTSISAEQADTSLSDLLFPSHRDFFAEHKTFRSDKRIWLHLNRRVKTLVGIVEMSMSQYVEHKDM